MKSKRSGHENVMNCTLRDLRLNERPWNKAKGTVGRPCKLNFSTQEKDVIQSNPSTSSGKLSIVRVLTWDAGEFVGSGKVFFHDSNAWAEWKKILANIYRRVRGTHDLETRQHCLRVSRSLYRRSTMWSVISGGSIAVIPRSCFLMFSSSVCSTTPCKNTTIVRTILKLLPWLRPLAQEWSSRATG